MAKALCNPIIGQIIAGRKEIDRADKTEHEGQNPNRHPDAKPGANQLLRRRTLRVR